EEQRAVGFSGKTDQFAARLRRGRIEDVLQIGRLTTQTWAVVDDLAVDFSGSVINKGHSVPLAKETIDVLVGNTGKGRILVIISSSDLFKHRRQLVGDLLAPQFDQAETGTLVKDDDQQEAANDGNVNALFFALVRQGWELLLADELRHSSRGGDIAGRERR